MSLLIVLHIVLCLFLIGVILLQPGKSDMGVSFGGGSSSQSIFGSKGAGNFLTKTTSIFAIAFLLTSFLITKMRMKETESSVIDTVETSELPTKKPTPPQENKASKAEPKN